MKTRNRRPQRPPHIQDLRLWIVAAAIVCLSAAAWGLRSSSGPSSASAATHAPAGRFDPTIENTELAPESTPDGMVWIPGGEFSMGAPDAPDHDEVGMRATFDARPIHRVYVDGFWMD